MADTYAIIGFSNESPVVLHQSGSYTDCERFKDSYTRWGDWGGYEVLALYEIAPTQSADTIHTVDSPIIAWCEYE
jgi:hypothetical protein